MTIQNKSSYTLFLLFDGYMPCHLTWQQRRRPVTTIHFSLSLRTMVYKSEEFFQRDKRRTKTVVHNLIWETLLNFLISDRHTTHANTSGPEIKTSLAVGVRKKGRAVASIFSFNLLHRSGTCSTNRRLFLLLANKKQNPWRIDKGTDVSAVHRVK